MTSTEFRRPAPGDYVEYYETYVSKVTTPDVVGFLHEQRDEALALFAEIPDEKADYRYAEGKWSTKQVLGHVVDAEWAFTGRALWFARNAGSSMPGMDPDDFVRGGNFEARELAGLAAEFGHVRAGNLILFESFDDEILERRGEASGCAFSVRAQLFIIAGHVQHHLGVLRERYL